MNCITIEVLLHYYYSPVSWIAAGKQDAPAQQEAHRNLIAHAAITDASKGAPTITEKGRAWVENILATPPPVAVWVDPRTKRSSELCGND